jgi:hypothetical protein
VALALIAALEKAKGKLPEKRFYGAYRAGLVVVWAVLTGKVLYEHAHGDPFGSAEWLTWTVATIVVVAVLIWKVIPRSTPRLPRFGFVDPRRTGETAGGVVAICLLTLALLALEAIGDGWPAEVTVAALFAIAGMLSLLLGALLIALGLRPGDFSHLRTGELGHDYAARFVSRRINGLAPVRPPNGHADDEGKHRLAEAVRRIRKGISTLADSNVPPFFKSFLDVEANGEQLTIRLYGVTGYSEQPTLEDTVEIPLSANTDSPDQLSPPK